MTPLDYALAYLKAGYSVIPIKADGSKAPDLPTWAEYQKRLATMEELRRWFADPNRGIGIVCGQISGNLEVIDFDDDAAFAAFVSSVGLMAISSIPQVKTPSGGRHLYFHRASKPPGNRKLSQRPIEVAEGTEGAHLIKGIWCRIKTLVETRGEGGQVVAPGSPPGCHVTKRPYQWLHKPEGIEL